MPMTPGPMDRSPRNSITKPWPQCSLPSHETKGFGGSCCVLVTSNGAEVQIFVLKMKDVLSRAGSRSEYENFAVLRRIAPATSGLTLRLFASYAERQADADPQLALAIAAYVGANVVPGRTYSRVVRKVKVDSASASHGKSRFAAR